MRCERERERRPNRAGHKGNTKIEDEDDVDEEEKRRSERRG